MRFTLFELLSWTSLTCFAVGVAAYVGLGEVGLVLVAVWVIASIAIGKWGGPYFCLLFGWVMGVIFMQLAILSLRGLTDPPSPNLTPGAILFRSIPTGVVFGSVVSFIIIFTQWILRRYLLGTVDKHESERGEAVKE